MSGPVPQPTALIDLRGGIDHTHRKPNDKEPKPPIKLPPCPKELDDCARQEWERISKLLLEVNLVTELDMPVMAAYCQSFSEWVNANEEVKELGAVYLGRFGLPTLNPWLKVSDNAFTRWMKAAQLLGMSPASRTSLKVERPEDADEIEDYRRKKRS